MELLFDGTKVICKDWWDPGHGPNRTELSVSEFLAGALHDTSSGRWAGRFWMKRSKPSTDSQRAVPVSPNLPTEPIRAGL